MIAAHKKVCASPLRLLQSDSVKFFEPRKLRHSFTASSSHLIRAYAKGF